MRQVVEGPSRTYLMVGLAESTWRARRTQPGQLSSDKSDSSAVTWPSVHAMVHAR